MQAADKSHNVPFKHESHAIVGNAYSIIIVGIAELFQVRYQRKIWSLLNKFD